MGTQTEVEDTDEVELEGSAQARIDTWKAVVEVVSAHPLDGVGYVGLAVHPAGDRRGDGSGRDGLVPQHVPLHARGHGDPRPRPVHLAVVAVLGARHRRRVRAAATRFDRQLAIGLTGATLALTVSCAFGDRFFSVVVTGPYWVICALVNDLVLERRNEKAA